jgi:hypothetical protein
MRKPISQLGARPPPIAPQEIMDLKAKYKTQELVYTLNKNAKKEKQRKKMREVFKKVKTVE